MSKNKNRISKALDEVKQNRSKKIKVDIKDIRVIILSDQHRGQKDGADDFKKCKSAYHAALGYYLAAGYDLYLLGDVEELWECRPKKVVKAYHDTLALEQRFAIRGRYKRIYGNHDDIWQYQSKVNKHLKRYIAKENENAKVYFGLILSVSSGKEEIGELFLVHGHQGSGVSDKYSKISRFFVRYFWRNFQRLTRIRYTTPAKDFDLRKSHELEMYRWSSKQEKLILIAGHTHHPVFSSESHENYIISEIEKLSKSLQHEKDPKKLKLIEDKIINKSAELEWVLAKSDGKALKIENNLKPSYFNTGCCSFSDGDITGIEIENGEIRLVRWPDDNGDPKKKVLRKADLKKLLV